jgi:orotidine-5'-phosphate decarboxylase
LQDNFSERIRKSARSHSSRIVLALDIVEKKIEKLQPRAISLINNVFPYLASVKINFHLLLPLGFREIASINDIAHANGLQTIADIKLNDIASTNEIAANMLWGMGFDAIIANPFVGYDGALDVVLKSARKAKNGVILLVYMSHPAASDGYGLSITNPKRSIFEEFVSRAAAWKADGVVVGATAPDRIAAVRKRIPKEMLIFSPGVGVQGGDAKKSVQAGSDFLIVGRSILEASDPLQSAKRICRESSSRSFA